MPTTTERPKRTLFAAGALALTSWFAALAILAYAVEPSPEVIAWVPKGRLAATLSAARVSVLDGQGGGFIRLRGEARGFVGALYANGAWIVLPSVAGGCRSARPRHAE